ncbi:phosphatase PAP2 family protein [Clostridium sp.]|uniref:phosphatase PAP2 family protein n=1 Tax=Clostridium sp. TaxID=1506 RepID=UPI00260B08BD|nr:phosphatase PAP2 family protein [Clostridium sp.]
MNLIQNIDNAILQYIQLNMRSSILDALMPLITSLGNKLTIWSLVGIALMVNKKYRRYGAMIICSLILCFIVGNLSLKPWIARIRPFEAKPLLTSLLIKPPSDFSFPSGHTMCSFAPATILYYMNKKTGIFAFCLGSIIGFSRLYLYVHYPSDVFCGAIIGVLLAIIIISTFNNVKNKNINVKN